MKHPMSIGPGPKFINSMNSLVVLHPAQGINSLITILPCPKENLKTNKNAKATVWYRTIFKGMDLENKIRKRKIMKNDILAPLRVSFNKNKFCFTFF
jgi:hypothetical protein